MHDRWLQSPLQCADDPCEGDVLQSAAASLFAASAQVFGGPNCLALTSALQNVITMANSMFDCRQHVDNAFTVLGQFSNQAVLVSQ